MWRDKSEGELVVASLVGNPGAFGELARRYRGAVFSVARQILRSDEDAEDVVQDVLLVAYRALPQLRDVSKFRNWLYAITRHRSMRFAERASRRQTDSLVDSVILNESRRITLEQEQKMAKEQESREIHSALESIPDGYGLVLRLRYMDQMRIATIADFLGIPQSTVKWRFYNGLRLLKEKLLAQRREEA